jgi:hypothetical protein
MISGPKRFLAARLGAQELTLERGLVFVAVSFMIGWTLKIPLVQGDPLLELATDAVFVFFYVLAYGLVLFLAWRGVGSIRDVRTSLAVYLYQAGVLQFAFSVVVLAMMGTLRAADAALADEVYRAVRSGSMLSFFVGGQDRLLASGAFRTALAVAPAGFAAMVA